jgi:integrase
MLILLKRPIAEVSEYLGHADVSITMRVYAHFLKRKKQDTMRDLEMHAHSEWLSESSMGTVWHSWHRPE